MKIHLFAQISTAFARVHEFTGEFETVTDVVRTTTPFPIARGGWWSRLVSIVAGTGLDAAFAARSRDAVSHRSASDGVDEGGLSTTCNKIPLPLTRVTILLFISFVAKVYRTVDPAKSGKKHRMEDDS